MAWLRRAKTAPAETVEPVSLGIDLDAQVLDGALGQLFEDLDAEGGVERYVAALKLKAELFGRLLNRQAIDNLDAEGRDALLERIFPVRRRLAPAVRKLGVDGFRNAVRELLYGKGDLAERMAAFEAKIPAEGKARRTMRDLTAELLHFTDPERYPLMTRWVWDVRTDSGALRELTHRADHYDKLPVGGEPGVYEALRQWVVGQLESHHFYRDLAYVADLVLAQVYGVYIKSTAESFLRTDFGGGGGEEPAEHVRKLLGIDEQRRSGGTRLKLETEAE
jgi:hypothetical protein